jgi:hypothetical protein
MMIRQFHIFLETGKARYIPGVRRGIQDVRGEHARKAAAHNHAASSIRWLQVTPVNLSAYRCSASAYCSGWTCFSDGSCLILVRKSYTFHTHILPMELSLPSVSYE